MAGVRLRNVDLIVSLVVSLLAGLVVHGNHEVARADEALAPTTIWEIINQLTSKKTFEFQQSLNRLNEGRLTDLVTSTNPSEKTEPLTYLVSAYQTLQSEPQTAVQLLERALTLPSVSSNLRYLVEYQLVEAKRLSGDIDGAVQLAQSSLKKKQREPFKKALYEQLIESLSKSGRHTKLNQVYHSYRRQYSPSRREETVLQSVAKSYIDQGMVILADQTLEELSYNYPRSAASKWAMKLLFKAQCRPDRPYVFSQDLLRALGRSANLDMGLRNWLVLQATLPMRNTRGRVKKLDDEELYEHYFSSRLYDEAYSVALATFNSLPAFYAQSSKSAADRGDLLYRLGRVGMRQGQPRKAMQWLNKFVANYPKHRKYSIAAEQLGDAYKYLGKTRAAAAMYQHARRVNRRAKHLGWAHFWQTYRSGQWSEALKLLTKPNYVRMSDPAQVNASIYWQARIYAKLGEFERSRKLYEKLLRHGKDDYFGTLVAARYPNLLNELPVPGAPSTSASIGFLGETATRQAGFADSGTELDKTDGLSAKYGRKRAGHSSIFDLTKGLIQHGLWSLAEPLHASVGVRNYVDQTDYDDFRNVSLMLHDYRASRLPLRFSNGDSDRDIDSWLARLSHHRQFSEQWRQWYPKAYPKIFAALEPQLQIDTDLLRSIMRAESFYDSNALSPVGAVGLMQIMPYTALKIAKDLGADSYKLEDLRRPEVNIGLGSYYLDTLARYYRGNVVLAIAAYNAGPKAVDYWLRACQGCETDEFVEAIPYRETRRYVRKVLGYYSHYQQIYDGRPSINWMAKLPENQDSTWSAY